MIVIKCPLNGIALVDPEKAVATTSDGYAVNEYGEIMKFESGDVALGYLIVNAGYAWYDIENECIEFIYTNERRECKCSQCECKFDCFMRGKVQRLPPKATNG